MVGAEKHDVFFSGKVGGSMARHERVSRIASGFAEDPDGARIKAAATLVPTQNEFSGS